MADTTDRPSSSPLETGITGVPPPVGDEPETYRPLSLLALGGFGLAVCTAVAICFGGWIALLFNYRTTFILCVLLAPVGGALAALLRGSFEPRVIARVAGLALAAVLALAGLGGLLAFTSSNPWLWPSWGFLLPGTALVVSWLGRSHILRSENTLSGLSLCNWGLGLATVFTLLYVAYYGAVALGVRLQSEAYANEWVNRLDKAELDRAFLMTIPPDNRPPEDDKLRLNIESYFNQPTGPNAPGVYDEFGGKDFVHMLQSRSGTGVKIEPRGLQEWNFENDEYTVRYAYHIASALVEFDLLVKVKGVQSQHGQFKGRQWFVELRDTGLPKEVPPTVTEQGKPLAAAMGSARDFVEKWKTRWHQDDDDAYLATVPAGQRDRVLHEGPALWAVAGTTLPPGADATRAPYYQGALIAADSKTFFGSKANLTAVPPALRQAFRPGAEKPDRAFVVETKSLPIMQATDGRKQVVFDLRFLFGPTHKTLQNVEVDARLIVDCDDPALTKGPPQWQIKQIQLLRARTLTLKNEPNPGGNPQDQPGDPGRGRGR